MNLCAKSLVLISLLLASSCSHFMSNKDTDSAAGMLEVVQTLQKRKLYADAIYEGQLLLEKYPLSKEAAQVKIIIADSYLLKGEYESAIFEFTNLLESGGKTEKDYILIQLTKSYDKQIPKVIERDTSQTKETLSFAHRLLEEYPNSAYAAEAKSIIQKNERIEALKELSIADYYLKREKWNSAKSRLLKIYHGKWAKHLNREELLQVLYGTAMSYYSLKNFSEGKVFYTKLLDLDPNSKEFLKLKHFLDNNL